MAVIQLGFNPNDHIAIVQRTDNQWVKLRRDKCFWLNPFHFVDGADIQTHKEEARVFFLDLLVYRPTEFAALIRMYARAYKNIDNDQLTDRQTEALLLAHEAVQLGIHPTSYLVKRLHVTRQAAYQLLQRAGDQAKMFTLDNLDTVYSIETTSIQWQPSEQDVLRRMFGKPKPCAGHGTDGCKGVVTGRYALCYPCYKYYGIDGERRERHEKWLIPEIKRIRQAHREDVMNDLYREHYDRMGVRRRDDDMVEVYEAA